MIEKIASAKAAPMLGRDYGLPASFFLVVYFDLVLFNVIAAACA